jgi:two-component system sensor histidine kinase CpxA
MSRLYWKIFVSFWLVLLATMVVTAAVNRLTADEDLATFRLQSLRASLDALAEQAQRTLDREGEEGLRSWLRDKEASLQVPMFIIDPQGNELLGRQPPPLPPLGGRSGNGEPDLLSRLPGAQPMRPPRESRAMHEGPPHGLKPRNHPRSHVLQSPAGDYVFIVPILGRPGPRWMPSPNSRRLFPLVLVLISGFACFLLARYLTRPIQAFRTAGQRIAAGDMSARVGAPVNRRKDEFGALAQDFDRMAEQVEALLESRQRLLRDVSHELRSPLARLQAAAGLLRQQAGATDDPNLDRIEQEADTLNDMIGQILIFARLQSMDQVAREPVDIVELVGAVVENARFEAQAAGRGVALTAPEQVNAQLDPQLIQSAVDNVVRNAVQHSNKRTAVTVAVTDGILTITIVDDGPGAPEENLAKLFDAFFTVAPSNSAAGKGAGIGLAIARRAVELHGGSIKARNRADGSGLEVQLELRLN